MDERSRRRFLLLTGTMGLTAFAGCAGNAPVRSTEPEQGSDSSDADNLLGVLSKAGPSEFSNSDDVHSGWVHTVAHGETYDVTFDVRICHDPRDEVAVELTESSTGEYALSFTTSGGTHEESGCDFGTRVTGSGSIPTDFESLTVEVNGRMLRTAERDGTLPSLHPVPDPIDAR